MTDNIKATDSLAESQEALRTLAQYLERSLDKATSVVMMRHAGDTCTVYLGHPDDPPEELKKIGTIASALANGMLEATRSGANRIDIDGQVYRFVRSFTQVGNTAAIVFAAD